MSPEETTEFLIRDRADRKKDKHSRLISTRRSGRLPRACLFSHEADLFFTDPTKSAKRCCQSKFCVVRVARDHTYCTVHPCKAVRTADETCVKTVGKLDILCHLGRTLGSAGISRYST